MFNWNDVKYFLEVARCGSVSAAAERLSVNHTTVARRIQAFEEGQKAKLFERTSSGYTLSETGKQIVAIAEQIERQNQQLARTIQGRDKDMAGEVSITMPHDIFEFCLAKPITKLQQQHSNITVNCSVTKGVKNLAAREADIAIRLTPAPPEYLIGKKVANIQHALYQGQYTDRGFTPIIAWSNEVDVPLWASERFNRPKIVARVDDLLAMYKAVEAGLGIARMPCYLANAIKSPTVDKLDVNLPQSDWGLWVLSHVDLRDTARVKVCRNFLMDTLTSNSALFENAEYEP